MDCEGNTFVFLSKYKQDVFIKMLYILCFYFSTIEKRKNNYILVHVYPFNMNRMKHFNYVFKIEKEKL